MKIAQKPIVKARLLILDDVCFDPEGQKLLQVGEIPGLEYLTLEWSLKAMKSDVVICSGTILKNCFGFAQKMQLNSIFGFTNQDLEESSQHLGQKAFQTPKYLTVAFITPDALNVNGCYLLANGKCWEMISHYMVQPFQEYMQDIDIVLFGGHLVQFRDLCDAVDMLSSIQNIIEER